MGHTFAQETVVADSVSSITVLVVSPFVVVNYLIKWCALYNPRGHSRFDQQLEAYEWFRKVS